MRSTWTQGSCRLSPRWDVRAPLVLLLLLSASAPVRAAAKDRKIHASRGTSAGRSRRRLDTVQPVGASPAAENGAVPGFMVLPKLHADGLSLGLPDGMDHGGWWPLVMDYTFPAPVNISGVRDAKYLQLDCYDFGNSFAQPVTDLYKRRHAPPTPLPGGVPRAFWLWEGNITRQQFDAVPDSLRGPQCLNCLDAVRYQIIDGHLYRKGIPPDWAAMDAAHREPLEFLQDMMLFILHMWDLPDMDFIVHNGAGCPPDGSPVLGWNICRGRKQAGFGWPYVNVWRYALGPVQNEAYHRCMLSRYNLTNRRPGVFWRGSTTDPGYGGQDVRIKVVSQMARLQVHKMSEGDPVLDTKISKILPGADACVHEYLKPLGDRAHIEDYAKHAMCLDIDGHGMSGRFGHRLVHFATPVLKQASLQTAFIEHLVAPGHMVELFDNDVLNLKRRAHHLIKEWTSNPHRLLKQAEQLQGFGAAFLHNVAVAEAAAYSLLQYSKKLAWKTVRDDDYSHVPFAHACKPDHNRLPAQVCDELRARPPRP